MAVAVLARLVPLASTTQVMSGNDAIELAAVEWDLTSNGTTLAQSATNKPLV